MELGTCLQQNWILALRAQSLQSQAPVSSTETLTDSRDVEASSARGKSTVEDNWTSKEKAGIGKGSSKPPENQINPSQTVAKAASQAPGSKWKTIKAENDILTFKCSFCHSGPHYFIFKRNDGRLACRACSTKA